MDYSLQHGINLYDEFLANIKKYNEGQQHLEVFNFVSGRVLLDDGVITQEEFTVEFKIQF